MGLETLSETQEAYHASTYCTRPSYIGFEPVRPESAERGETMLNSRTCEDLDLTPYYLLFSYLGTYVWYVQYKGLAGVKLYLPMRV